MHLIQIHASCTHAHGVADGELESLPKLCSADDAGSPRRDTTLLALLLIKGLLWLPRRGALSLARLGGGKGGGLGGG